MDEHTYSVSLTVTVRGPADASEVAAALGPALAASLRTGRVLHASLSVIDAEEVEEETETSAE